MIEEDEPIKQKPKKDDLVISIGFSNQAHHRIGSKGESYSLKGYGNGFVSKGDRFSGIDEQKFISNSNLFL